MRWRNLAVLTLWLVVTLAHAAPRTFTDDAGRTLTLPDTIHTAYATSQIGIITLYTLAPDKLAGWIFALQPEETPFIAARYHHLPVLGGWSGRSSTANVEEIARVHPDVIFSIGTIDATQRDQADHLQRQTGIPVVMLDAPLTAMDRTYRILGDLLNEPERAATLAAYCHDTITGIAAQVARVPEAARKRVYYAEGRKGLETDPAGSFHTEVLDFVRGINVADVPNQRGYGRAEVSLEQVMAWNPAVVIVGFDKQTRDGFTTRVYDEAGWQHVAAVRNRAVYQIPFAPFDWFDRPPSVNRLIGVKWLANLLYPDAVPLDLDAEVRTFYRLFYHTEVSDDALAALLARARPTPGASHDH